MSLLFVTLGLLLTARSTPAQRTAPNVLLVTIDTLRADRLGSYGYKLARTPVLDRLAVEGTRFADATTHAPLTYPAHAAILTGRYPAAFAIRANGMRPLPASASTLAERLQHAGYSTAAIVGSVILDRSYGLDQGFDLYDDRFTIRPGEVQAVAEVQRSAAEVTSAALAWLKGRGRQPNAAPWFLWAHYYDPHLPYEAPATYVAAGGGRPYDAEVSYVDAELGRLLASIERSRTLIVVTADHGEALGDHGELDHGFFLYDATLHVPLIVAGSGRDGRPVARGVVTEQVRSVDIAPTIAGMAGIAVDSSEDGESLVPLLEGRKRTEVPVSLAESWYPRLHFGWSELRSARVGEWKYIAAPKPELYDLRSDPAEQRNLVRHRAPVAARLAAELERLSTAAPDKDAVPAAQPDAATLERLRALGYVGTLAPVTSTSSAENPLDHIAEYRAYRELFTRALILLGRKQPGAAAGLLQRLVKMNVRAFEAHLYLGNAYAAQSKWDAALGEYDAAAILNPSVAAPQFEAAKVLSMRGAHDDAVARCRAGLEKEPRSFYGHYTLGVIYQKAGRRPEALKTFSEAVALNDQDPRAHANLAGAAMRTGDLDLAARHFQRMIDLKHQVAPAQFNLGVIAVRKGDRAEAARRYKLALAADPTFKPAIEALQRLRPERGAGGKPPKAAAERERAGVGPREH